MSTILNINHQAVVLLLQTGSAFESEMIRRLYNSKREIEIAK